MKKFRYILVCLLAMNAVQEVRSQNASQEPLMGREVRIENMKVIHRDQTLVVDMDVVLDSLAVKSNQRIVFTPVVKNGESEVLLPPLVVNGRKQQIMYERDGYKSFLKESVVVRRRNETPQTVHYSAVIPGEEWMKNSNLVVEEDLCGCGDVLNQNHTVVKRLRTPVMVYMRPKAEARKERHVEGRAFIDFPVDRIELYPEYRKNPLELEKIMETIRKVKDDRNVSITSISIHGYASPEDTYEHNTYLAKNRARTLKDYVCRLSALSDSVFRVDYTPEDWDGLRAYVSESDLKNREAILKLIDDKTLDPDVKEYRIRLSYPDDYRFMLQNWYPALRHSDYVVTYVVRPFSVEEAKELLQSKPQLLSLEEMYLVAQTYEAGSEEFNEVFEVAVRMYPDDPTANLNAACTRLVQEDYEGARRYLSKAGNSAEAEYARGVLEMMTGNEAQARVYLKKALDMGVAEAEKNLKLLELNQEK